MNGAVQCSKSDVPMTTLTDNNRSAISFCCLLSIIYDVEYITTSMTFTKQGSSGKFFQPANIRPDAIDVGERRESPTSDTAST